MDALSGSRSRSFSWVAPVGALLGVALAAWFDARLLAGYVTVLVGAATATVVRRWLGAGPAGQISAAVAAGMFAPAALEYGERGVLWAAAASLLLTAGRRVFAGPVGHLLSVLAVELLLVTSAGFVGAYLVLIRVAAGPAALIAGLVMLVGYTAALRLRVDFGKLPGGPALPAAAGAVVSGVASLRLGGVPVGTVSSLVLGAAVGLAAALGCAVAVAVGGHVTGGDRRARAVINVLQPVLSAVVAIPIFFYGLTLYLR
ncbi:MAG: hypothetical protein WD602_04115 [Actinomycetota bacterium]